MSSTTANDVAPAPQATTTDTHDLVYLTPSTTEDLTSLRSVLASLPAKPMLVATDGHRFVAYVPRQRRHAGTASAAWFDRYALSPDGQVLTTTEWTLAHFEPADRNLTTVYTDSRWANWDREASPADDLTDPELDAIVPVLRQHESLRPAGNDPILAITHDRDARAFDVYALPEYHPLTDPLPEDLDPFTDDYRHTLWVEHRRVRWLRDHQTGEVHFDPDPAESVVIRDVHEGSPSADQVIARLAGTNRKGEILDCSAATVDYLVLRSAAVAQHGATE